MFIRLTRNIGVNAVCRLLRSISMQSFYLWERELKSNLDNNRYHCDPAPVGAQVGLIIIQNNEIKAFVVKNYSMVRHLWERYIGCLPPIMIDNIKIRRLHELGSKFTADCKQC